MCGIYCVYKQSRSCQLPFSASPIFHFEIGDIFAYSLYYREPHAHANRGRRNSAENNPRARSRALFNYVGGAIAALTVYVCIASFPGLLPPPCAI